MGLCGEYGAKHLLDGKVYISLDKVLLLDNEKKASFSFALCLVNRTFASDFYKTTNG